MLPNSISLVLQHAISITANNKVFCINEFLSQKFSSLYLNNIIPGSVKLCILQLTGSYISLLNVTEECINYINKNDRFIVIS